MKRQAEVGKNSILQAVSAKLVFTVLFSFMETGRFFIFLPFIYAIYFRDRGNLLLNFKLI